MKKRYVNLILAMASASVLVLGSVPAMEKTDGNFIYVPIYHAILDTGPGMDELL